MIQIITVIKQLSLGLNQILNMYMMSGNGFQSKKYTFKTGAKGDFGLYVWQTRKSASFGDANSGVFNKDTDTEEWNRTV